MSGGLKTVRAIFSDAKAQLSRQSLAADPAPDVSRSFDGIPDPVLSGRWAGAPVDRLPPGCPVVPLGIDGTAAFFIDSAGQLISVDRSEWNKKTLLQLFALTPNYLAWAWPRFSAKTMQVNGLEVDEACSCLLKAATIKGLFNPSDRVRGRGGWADKAGRFVWHSGEQLWRVETKGGKSVLVAADPGEVDQVFYARRPAIVTPWPESVAPHESPAVQILADLATWSWERPNLDPLMLLGWLGCAFLGGGLDWRPTVFFTGDKGVGKSKLQSLIKAVLGPALHASADTTAAGIYQRVRQDSLPVAVDELEADADNRRVIAVIKLARLAASGAMMFRGGAEHEGVEFRACNAFAFSSINPPPLAPQDKSRIALLNLGRLDQQKIRGRDIVVDEDTAGRMILRCLMDGWQNFPRILKATKNDLFEAGLDSRQQDTYGTLLAVARLMLGDEAFDAATAVSETGTLGALIADATAVERSEQTENWRACLEHLLGATIDAWKGGEKPTIGSVIQRLEDDDAYEAANSQMAYEDARVRLAAAGLGIKARGVVVDGVGLAIPSKGPLLAKVFAGTPWSSGVWMNALKQAPHNVVLRGAVLGDKGITKINRMAERCVIVDLAAYDAHVESEK